MTKPPTAASLKRVNAENLKGLGAERLAELLLAVANTRPELKRQLRMELAATQGVDHLAAEIDKRLTSLEALTSKISWRQRPTFLRDLDALRRLIAERMASLDPTAALDRMWRLVGVARRVSARMRDKHGELEVLFTKAAGDIASLVHAIGDTKASDALTDAILHNPRGWLTWLPIVLQQAPGALVAATLDLMSATSLTEKPLFIRQLADAVGDVDAYRATYSERALTEPGAAAEVADRLLAAGRIQEAGQVLEAARAEIGQARQGQISLNYDWESSWISFLEASGAREAARSPVSTEAF